MDMYMKLIGIITVVLLTGCGSTILAYEPTNKLTAREAYEEFDQLITTQHTDWRPKRLEINDRYIFWSRDDGPEKFYFKELRSSAQLMSWHRKFKTWYVVSLIGKDGDVKKHIYYTREQKQAERLVEAVNTIIAIGQSNQGGAKTDAEMYKRGSNRYVKISSGTAFVINEKGQAVTNNHLASECEEIRVSGFDGVAKVVNFDKVNDLSLIQLPFISKDYANINIDTTSLQQGADIVVFGFPLNTLLSSGGNFTPGIISATNGLGNNTSQIQITAPIQPGSSGSPVIDKSGNVIGVVCSTLDGLKSVRETGSIPQSVNFAIHGQTLKSFLDASNATYHLGSKTTQEKHNTVLAADAKKWTKLVECWGVPK